MEATHLSAPWQAKQGAEDAESILGRIEELLSSSEVVHVLRRGFGLTVDVGPSRLFFRTAYSPAGDIFVEYGYYKHVPFGFAEVAVGEWDVKQAYHVRDSLPASPWSGENLLQRVLKEVLEAIRALEPEARIVDGAVLQKGEDLTVSELPGFRWSAPPAQ